jgi:amidase
MGCSIEAVDCSSLVDAEVGDLFARIQSREIWNEHGSWVDANLSYLAPDVQSRLRRSRELSGDPGISKTEDREARSVYTHKVSSLLQGNKVLVLPVVPRRGPMVRWTDDELLSYRVACFRLTGPSSLTGFPQVVIPTSRDTGNVPAVGVLGPAYSDLGLIELARDYAAGA